MTELAIRDDALAPVYQEDPTGGRLVAWARAASAANQLAKALVRTTFVPAHFKGNDGDATAAIMAGDEVGMAPLASLRAFYVVHGTPALYARSMVALVQRHGHQVWTEKSSDSEVVVCGQRRGSDKIERAPWPIARAQKAGYTGNKKYATNPQEMLWAKGASEICRKIASDVLAGMPQSVEDLELEDQPTTTVVRSNAEPKRVQRKPKADPSPVVDVEPTFDDPEPDAEPEPAEGITEPQSKKLHALFRDKGFTDRDDSLSYVSTILDRDITTTKELSKDDASRVIDALDRLEP